MNNFYDIEDCLFNKPRFTITNNRYFFKGKGKFIDNLIGDNNDGMITTKFDS